MVTHVLLITRLDERLRVLVLLDFPACPEDKLTSLLENLELRVDAWVVLNQSGDEKSPVDAASTRDLIASEVVARLDDPVTLVKQDDEDSEVRLQLVWEVFVTLGRPRIRSSEHFITFLPIAKIIASDSKEEDNDFLEPFAALEPNLLEPVRGLPGSSQPFLPLSRLEKVIPVQAKQDDQIRLRHRASTPIRAFTAVMPRLRYNKINTFLPDPTMIASLDLEMIPFGNVRGQIESMEVSMATGKATSLMPNFLPMACRSKDCMTFLYDLKSAQQSGLVKLPDPTNLATQPSSSNGSVDVLSITILTRLFLGPSTTAIITTSWTTNVDFSLALNPAFGAPSQALQRTNRPSSLNITPFADPKKQAQNNMSTATSRTMSTSLQHQVIPTTIPRQPLTSILSISFVGPDKPSRIGIPFSWRVLIVNNSPKAAKLAIVPLPRIQRPTNANQHFAKRHAPKASNSVLPSASTVVSQIADAGTASKKQHTRNGAGSIAKAVVEEHILYALHHQASSAGAAAVPPETDLVSLTAELRIGPLGIGQCHETEIKFVAYKAGTFNVDAIRVVDLATETDGGVGVISDVRELPEVVVEEDSESD